MGKKRSKCSKKGIQLHHNGLANNRLGIQAVK